MKTLTNRLCALTLLVLGCLAPFGVAAQRYYTPDLAIGFKGGATLSEMSWSPTVRQKFTPGMTAGLCLRYTEENHFGLVAELNFTQRGWAEKFNSDSNLDYKRQFSYLQLPIMTQIFFGSEKWRFFINLGPEIGYMVGDKTTANFNYRNIESVSNFPRNHRYEQLAMEPGRKFDYGIAGGLGVEMRLRRKHSILLEGRFYYGLANVFPSSRRDVFGASRGMSIECTLGYMFRII
ncbi:MAG: PorT family protein [Muribaculaceae bacterium]|nr:PorT family protein [Muribaculaceae bacterium]